MGGGSGPLIALADFAAAGPDAAVSQSGRAHSGKVPG